MYFKSIICIVSPSFKASLRSERNKASLRRFEKYSDLLDHSSPTFLMPNMRKITPYKIIQ